MLINHYFYMSTHMYNKYSFFNLKNYYLLFSFKDVVFLRIKIEVSVATLRLIILINDTINKNKKKNLVIFLNVLFHYPDDNF